MPRRPRIEVENGIFHVASRAVDNAFAYRGVKDREDFLDFLWTTVGTYEWLCQSYCLMGTHYHLIIQTPNANLAAGMQMLNGRYAQRFNWRYDRRGHLFAGRFLSVHVQDEEHLMAAHRYVARNPVRAGLCAHPRNVEQLRSTRWTRTTTYLPRRKGCAHRVRGNRQVRRIVICGHGDGSVFAS